MKDDGLEDPESAQLDQEDDEHRKHPFGDYYDYKRHKINYFLY